VHVLETAIQLLSLRQKPADDVFVLDGGCHHGTFTRKALDVFSSVSVLSFEPDPDSWKIAAEKFTHNNNVEIINAALGAQPGKAEFFRGPNTATNSLLPRPQSEAKQYYPESARLTGGTQVNVVAIDGECERRGRRSIDIMKLDLQGGEREALIGARKILERQAVSIIVVEVVFIQKYHEQPLFWQICEFLSGYGYGLFSLEDIKIGLYQDNQVSMRQKQWNQADAIFVSPAMRRALDS